MKKKVVKGGNTNLYKTRIRPRKLKRYSTTRSKNDRGAGLFKFLSNGLKQVSKRVPTSLSNFAKKALSEGTSIAKKQLQKKSVQKALKNAVSEASKMAVSHALQKVNSSNSPNIPTQEMPRLASRKELRRRRYRKR